MPYLVLTLEEMQAKGGFDRPQTETLTTALNSMESDGYALVAIEPAVEGGVGSSYVFHRGDADGSAASSG